jgi:hypothetical protein
VTSINQQEVQPMSGLNKLMGRGILPPVVHGVLDYPLAAVLIVLPLVLGFDDALAKWIAFALGIGAAVLAVGTAWQTGIVKIIPPLLHGYADIAVTVALIVLPFIVGFSEHTTALVFYLVVGAGGLAAMLVTRFEPRMAAERGMTVRMAA